MLVAWAVARLWPDDPSLTALVLRRAEAGDVLAALSGRDAAMLAASLAALAPASHAALVALRDTVLREGLAVGFTARDVATSGAFAGTAPWATYSVGLEKSDGDPPGRGSLKDALISAVHSISSLKVMGSVSRRGRPCLGCLR